MTAQASFVVSTIVSALPAIPRATRLKFSGPRFCSKNPEKSWALILKRKTFQAHLRIAVAHFYSNDKGLCEGAMSTSSLLASFRVRCSSPSAVEAELADPAETDLAFALDDLRKIIAAKIEI